jgi:hypothetical protein
MEPYPKGAALFLLFLEELDLILKRYLAAGRDITVLRNNVEGMQGLCCILMAV